MLPIHSIICTSLLVDLPMLSVEEKSFKFFFIIHTLQLNKGIRWPPLLFSCSVSRSQQTIFCCCVVPVFQLSSFSPVQFLKKSANSSVMLMVLFLQGSQKNTYIRIHVIFLKSLSLFPVILQKHSSEIPAVTECVLSSLFTSCRS